MIVGGLFTRHTISQRTITPATSGQGWQLILADLALILFLVTLSALAAAPTEPPEGLRGNALTPQFAPAQALFRPEPLGPSLSQWLAARPHDSRATLTIFAQASAADSDPVWAQAQALAADASAQGFAVRVFVTQGESSDLYASLAYDAEISAR